MVKSPPTPLFEPWWSIQRQCHSFDDCPKGPDVLGPLIDFLIQARNYPRQWQVPVVAEIPDCTDHVLY